MQTKLAGWLSVV